MGVTYESPRHAVVLFMVSSSHECSFSRYSLRSGLPGIRGLLRTHSRAVSYRTCRDDASPHSKLSRSPATQWRSPTYISTSTLPTSHSLARIPKSLKYSWMLQKVMRGGLATETPQPLSIVEKGGISDSGETMKHRNRDYGITSGIMVEGSRRIAMRL